MFYKLNAFELVLFLQHLRILLNEQYSLDQSITLIAEQTRQQSFHKYLISVNKDLKSGRSISHAFFDKRHPFPKSMVKCLSARPENTHQLVQTIKGLEDNYKIHAQTSRQLLSHDTYTFLEMLKLFFPFLLLLAAKPLLNSMAQLLGSNLPAPTSMLLTCINYFNQHLLICLLLSVTIAFGVATAISYFKYKSFHMFFLFTLLKNHMQNNAGLVPALTWAWQSIDSYFPSKAIRNVINNVRNGYELTASIKQQRYFDPFIGDIVGLGEQKDELTLSFTELASYYNTRIAKDFRKYNGAMTAYTFLMISSILVAIYLPIFKVAGTM